MSWQEVILTAGSLFFTIALIPSVISKDKPALASSVLTALILFLFGVVYASLGLWFAACTVSITGTTWTILAVQKYRMNTQRVSKAPETTPELHKS